MQDLHKNCIHKFTGSCKSQNYTFKTQAYYQPPSIFLNRTHKQKQKKIPNFPPKKFQISMIEVTDHREIKAKYELNIQNRDANCFYR
jgi:hypothetical protein